MKTRCIFVASRSYLASVGVFDNDPSMRWAFESLVVRSILLRFLCHEPNIGDVAHRTTSEEKENDDCVRNHHKAL